MRTLQPIIWSWRGVPGKGVPLTQTSVTSTTKYAVDAANGGVNGLAFRAVGGANSFVVNAAGITASALHVSGVFSVTSTSLVTNLNADMLDGLHAADFALDSDLDDYLPLTGGVLSGDLELENLEVNQDASVDGSMVVNVDLAVDGNFDVDGDSDQQLVRLTMDPAANPQLLFRASAARTYWGMGGSDASAPNFQLFTLDGSLVATEQFEITETGRVNARSMEVYDGDLIVSSGTATISSGVTIENGGLIIQNSGGAIIDGQADFSDNIVVAGDSSVFNGTVTFNDQVSLNDPVTFTDQVTITGGELNLSTAVIDFDLGSGSGFTEDSWSGYVEIKHDGSTKYVPYLSSAP